MMWTILALLIAGVAVMVWARAQGLIAEDAPVWRWFAGAGALLVAIWALLRSKDAATTSAIEAQLEDVADVDAQVAEQHAAADDVADAIIEHAEVEAVAIETEGARSSSSSTESAARFDAAFGDP